MVFDIARITANNGWAMAVIGAVLVMLGLATLSLIIAQLHKIIGFFENKTIFPPTGKGEAAPAAAADGDVDYLADPESSAKRYKVLTEKLGDPFDLTQLYQLAQRDQLPHPHLTLRTLREAGLLVPAGEGTFSWKTA